MPIDDLPVEILVEIFTFAMMSPLFAFGGSNSIILTSHVCRTWRDITLDSTILWRDIRISPSTSLLQASQLFARSKGSPISVSIDAESPTATLGHCMALLQCVAVERVRIRALYVQAPLYILSMLSRVVFSAEAKLPQLQSLVVIQEYSPHLNGTGRTRDLVTRWILNLDAPQLQSLAIAAVTPTSHSAFGRLIELNIQKSGYFELSSADGALGPPLAHFLKLEVLSIAASPLPTLLACHPTDTCIVSLTLSDLRSADIPPRVLSHFLSTLRMPALEHLVIERLYGRLWDEFVAWLRDPAAQYPALRTVFFDSLEFTDIDEKCLRAFTSVSTLGMTCIDPWPLLRILESNPRVCPRLRAVDSDMGADGKIYIRGRSAGPPE
ncbi:hypothetical protein B0H16DRAFT_1594948 [Mycena metata]|uniref:F-box domain-containing protein n=1 Tax=Mycena metata TaxID=1033252 RepID=A0AAD7MNI5_9AGAR|nr:hypothetical protein B0H16DRAFT_1594948 [Mycena metata]